MSLVHTLALGLSVVLLSGCAVFSADGGMDAVTSLTQQRTGQIVKRQDADGGAAAAQARVNQLLAEPLTADTAVQLALINNRGLQAALSELGVAEADRVQAGRLRNPGFSFSRLRGGSDVEIDRGVMFDLLGLLTLPIRSDIESRRFEQIKLQTVAEAVGLAADTRKAYFSAVAAQQTVQFMEQVKTSAEAGAELAQGMLRAGNFSKLDQARHQVFYADATTQVARAKHNATATREQLTRLLGLSGTHTAFKLPERLPDLPVEVPDMPNIEAQAMEQRLDVWMIRRDAEATAKALGLTQATAFVNVLDAGYINKSETGKPRANGFEISLELPLFDWNSRSRKAESLYMAALHRTADVAVRARSEVRSAYSAYRNSYDIAQRYRQEIVPLRKTISDEMLLRYNGMLSSVFELLADAREQAVSVNAAIESQRDFWLAETDLQLAINGSGSAITEMRGQSMAADHTSGKE